jgi:dipeptidyl aminopeptidase/acylaminoacyl peptidase
VYEGEMRLRTSLAGSSVVLLVAACGAEPSPPPAAPAPAPTGPSAVASVAPPLTAPTKEPAAPASHEPTALTAEQKAKDAALAPRAAAIVDAYPNWNGFFSTLVASYSPDGKRVLFGSTRDGLPEIYLGDVAKPDGAPKAITRGPERAIWAAFTHDGKSIVFNRDTKGDENHRLYKANLDGSNVVELTPGEVMHRDEPFEPSKLPGTIFYSAAKTTDTTSRLFRQSLGGGEPREAKLVYSQPIPGGLGDVTPDGKRALFVEFHSDVDLLTREVDLATGQAHRVYPPEGAHAPLHSVGYSEDGKRVFLVTEEKDKNVLLALDPATGKELGRFVHEPNPSATLGVLVAPKGDRLVLRIDAGNHGEVRILDAKTLKPVRDVKVPLGDVQVGAFRPDGGAFSLLVSLPNQPADVFEVSMATGAVKPLRADKRAGLEGLPPIEASIESTKAFDGLTIPINRYLPKIEGGKKLPTIIIFHGGPATSYAVRWNPYARFFVAQGYAVLEPNVRGSSGFGAAYMQADNREKRADWLKDLATVNEWAKAQPWCDGDRVVVWGQSYGGYTTLMAMTRQPTLWRAGVDLYGVADLRKFLLTTDASIRVGFVDEFGDVDKDAALLEQFSPMRDVDKITRPLFVYQGQNDPRVPRTEGDAIVAALRARGVPVEYMVAGNEGHTVDRRETKIELLTRTARFLDESLR